MQYKPDHLKPKDKKPLDQIPSRIKYYLLDWKDKNMSDYMKMYQDQRLRDLTFRQLHELYYHASRSDNKIMAAKAE